MTTARPKQEAVTESDPAAGHRKRPADRDGVRSRLRRPEYTGENRCMPCTVTNVGILGVLAATAWVLVAPVAAVALCVVGAAAIALRGYLVPGTPALTKRYVPEWLLAPFDQQPASQFTTATGEFDVAGVLDAGGVLEDDASGDVRVAPAFDAAWRTEMTTVEDEGAVAVALAELSKLDAEGITFSAAGQAYAAWYDDDWIGQWPSRAALVADVAAARVLAGHVPSWARLPVASRSEVVAGMRVLLEACPTCDGAVALGTETQASCCREYEVVAANCADCDARVFELPTDGLADTVAA